MVGLVFISLENLLPSPQFLGEMLHGNKNSVSMPAYGRLYCLELPLACRQALRSNESNESIGTHPTGTRAKAPAFGTSALQPGHVLP